MGLVPEMAKPSALHRCFNSDALSFSSALVASRGVSGAGLAFLALALAVSAPREGEHVDPITTFLNRISSESSESLVGSTGRLAERSSTSSSSLSLTSPLRSLSPQLLPPLILPSLALNGEDSNSQTLHLVLPGSFSTVQYPQTQDWGATAVQAVAIEADSSSLSSSSDESTSTKTFDAAGALEGEQGRLAGGSLLCAGLAERLVPMTGCIVASGADGNDGSEAAVEEEEEEEEEEKEDADDEDDNDDGAVDWFEW